jgi:[ribosomal protein S18]-alanine N-acetyltransferase
MRSKRTKQPRSHFTAVWEFHVPTNKRRAFEKAYRPNGDWASLFRRGEGYIRTELILDPATPGRYVTFDFWTSRLAYQRFKRQNVALYKALDKRCEMLTQSERLIGEFEKAVPARLIWSGASANVAADNTRIRPATAADIPAIIAIERSSESAAHWSESAYHDIFRSAAVRISLVSEHGHGSLVGFVIARIGGEDCELENIVVADSMQRQGVGSELVNGLKEEAQRRDIARILLEVRESNAAARALYKKCGFQIIGRRNSYYGSPAEDAILYTLTNV